MKIWKKYYSMSLFSFIATSIFLLAAAIDLDAQVLDGSSSTENTEPYDIEKFQDYLEQCKLQAPESNTAASSEDIMNGYSSDKFYVVDTNKIAFNQTGTLNRTELRNNTNWYLSDGDQTLHCNVKIAYQTCEQVTIIQIHDDANAGDGPNKPLLRVYKHTNKAPNNHIWAAVKLDDGGVNTEHFDLGADPGGFFDCDVSIKSDSMIIEMDGVEKLKMDVSYWNFPSYWKNGVYLQDEGEATSYFNELTLSTGFDTSADDIYVYREYNDDLLDMKLFPNPAKDKVSILLENSKEPQTVYIYSSNGKLLDAHTIYGNSEQINISHLKEGLYYFVIRNDNPVLKSFIKE